MHVHFKGSDKLIRTLHYATPSNICGDKVLKSHAQTFACNVLYVSMLKLFISYLNIYMTTVLQKQAIPIKDLADTMKSGQYIAIS